MTLRDPSNPARWPDGKPRSQANAFDVAWTPMHRFDTLKEQRHEAARRRTAKQVREARAAGRNLSVAALRKRAT